MSTFQQALEAYSRGRQDFAGLRRMLLEELSRTTGEYESRRQEILESCLRQNLDAPTIERLLADLDAGLARRAAVHSVSLPAAAGDATAATLLAEGAEAEEETVREHHQAVPAAVGTPPPATAPKADTTTGIDAPTVCLEPDAELSRPAGEVVVTVPETARRDTRSPAAGTPGSKGQRLRPGDVLNDQFELEEAIGEGGMGQIFRAKDTLDLQFSESNPYVAVKVLSDSFSGHKDSVMALHRETRNARKLQHENIINVYTFGQDHRTGQYFMVMEYLRGEPLNHYMQRKGLRGLPFDEVWRICSGVGGGLQHAHSEGIVHSDIKPSNIWITDSGKVKVLDFGIARVVNPDTQTVWGGLPAASVPYAAEEVLRQQDPDERDDVYALACVVYELLTGRHPYKKQGAIEAKAKGLSPNRPKGLKGRQWKTLREALSLRRDERTANVAAFLDGLRPQPWRWGPVVSTAGAGLLFLLMVTVLLGEWTGLGDGPSEEERYVARLLEIEVSQPLSDEDLPMYLQMGHEATEIGREEFANDDLQQGNQTLKNGPSVAFRDFYDVLRGTEDPERRLAAAKGIFTIQRLYANTIDRLHADGAVKTALWLACQSLAQPPGTRTPEWARLRDHYESLWREVKGESAPAPSRGCNSNEVQDVWGRDLTFRSPSAGWRVPDRRNTGAAPGAL